MKNLNWYSDKYPSKKRRFEWIFWYFGILIFWYPSWFILTIFVRLTFKMCNVFTQKKKKMWMNLKKKNIFELVLKLYQKKTLWNWCNLDFSIFIIGNNVRNSKNYDFQESFKPQRRISPLPPQPPHEVSKRPAPTNKIPVHVPVTGYYLIT